MLTLRFLRSGRRNQAFFRVVLTEKSKPANSGFIKTLGWYNPHTKESSLEKEEVLSWLDKGAKPSNSLAKLLLANQVKHKQIVYTKDAKAAPKKKGGKNETPKPEPQPASIQDATANENKAEESADSENLPEQTKPEGINNVKSEDQKVKLPGEKDLEDTEKSPEDQAKTENK